MAASPGIGSNQNHHGKTHVVQSSICAVIARATCKAIATPTTGAASKLDSNSTSCVTLSATRRLWRFEKK